MSEEGRTAGKVIRAALIIFPTGLLVLGAVSMIWHLNNKQEKAQRSIRYAAGLMKAINAADLERYEKIIAETTDKAALASFIESTIGPENMGYSVQRITGKGTDAERVVALEVELSGTKRPRDIVLVVGNHIPLTGAAPAQTTPARATSVLLSTAHSLTGEPQTRSIRFVSLEDMTALERYYEVAISPMERVSHVVLLGSLGAITDAPVLKALHLEESGAVVLRPDLTGDPLEAATKLRNQIKDLAARL